MTQTNSSKWSSFYCKSVPTVILQNGIFAQFLIIRIAAVRVCENIRDWLRIFTKSCSIMSACTKRKDDVFHSAINGNRKTHCVRSFAMLDVCFAPDRTMKPTNDTAKSELSGKYGRRIVGPTY